MMNEVLEVGIKIFQLTIFLQRRAAGGVVLGDDVAEHPALRMAQGVHRSN